MKILNKVRPRTDSCLTQFDASFQSAREAFQGRVMDKPQGRVLADRCHAGKSKSSATLYTHRHVHKGQNQGALQHQKLVKEIVLFKPVNHTVLK